MGTTQWIVRCKMLKFNQFLTIRRSYFAPAHSDELSTKEFKNPQYLWAIRFTVIYLCGKNTHYICDKIMVV